jgi:hypothetical protein
MFFTLTMNSFTCRRSPSRPGGRSSEANILQVFSRCAFLFASFYWNADSGPKRRPLLKNLDQPA